MRRREWRMKSRKVRQEEEEEEDEERRRSRGAG